MTITEVFKEVFNPEYQVRYSLKSVMIGTFRIQMIDAALKELLNQELIKYDPLTDLLQYMDLMEEISEEVWRVLKDYDGDEPENKFGEVVRYMAYAEFARHRRISDRMKQYGDMDRFSIRITNPPECISETAVSIDKLRDGMSIVINSDYPEFNGYAFTVDGNPFENEHDEWDVYLI